ncbi:unnamed protein product, partial [Phaeothamnion confervicola]
LFAFSLTGCAGDTSTSASATVSSPAAARLTQARAKLDSDIAACTAAHGYDPRNATGIDEHALAPGELEWRDCAYKAARNYARVNSGMRLQYELLIHDDRTMTAQIQAGTFTRTERRAAVEARLADIREQEAAQLQAAQGAAEADQQQMRNTVETMRGFAM